MNVRKWQLEIAATNASSGSTFAGFENGGRTTCGDGDAGTVAPPSKVHVCSLEYLPLKKSAASPARFQRIFATCSAMRIVVGGAPRKSTIIFSTPTVSGIVFSQ